ncbi:MAG: RagB/SusD family nutrient uptake outer membrane protein [Bacteroidaceae bacterium]|nr:RagB/SusD family nutrient uptake outer membrane protein [Bacteroidaceae bacterium]
MKTFKYILFAIVCGVTFTACDDFLDITPEGQIKGDEMLTSPEGIEDALYGAYSQMRSQMLYGQELHFSTLEILAQNLTCMGNTDIEAMGNYEYDNTNVKGMFEGIWTAMYKNISNVNSILAADLVASASQYPYTIYKGEALGLRAFMHFDLMRLYAEQITLNPKAEGIPYATEFSLNTPNFEPLTKNYEHILADLHEAERLLANEAQYVNDRLFMTDRQIHCNLYAVQALLARVYLTMGDKDNAAIYAKKVIDKSPYKLNVKTDINGDLAGVLSQKETLFGIYFAEFYNNVYNNLQAIQSFKTLNPRDDIETIYEQNAEGMDYRTMAYFTNKEAGGTVIKRLSKFTDTYELEGMQSSRPKELILGINLIRLPEMYYIMAEALLESDIELATEYYNQVLESRGLSALREDQTLTQELINLERFKEYFGEGQTFFNLKRQHLNISAWDNTTAKEKVIPASKEIYVIPIPDSEYENRL